MVIPGAHVTSAEAQAIGYCGGGILAICLVPQIVKLVRTRSAGDIALSWALLYIVGLLLTLAYLVLVGAIAAWIPLCFEITGSITIIILKLLFDHTKLGRPPTPDGEVDADGGGTGGAAKGPEDDAAVVIGVGGPGGEAHQRPHVGRIGIAVA